MPPNDVKETRAGAVAPVRWIVFTTDLLAAAGLAATMGIAFIDVLGRTFFRWPMPGATELTELAVAATVCCAFPSLAWRGLHATIDVLDGVVPAGLRPFQRGFANLLSALAFAVVSWRVWIEGDKTAKFGGSTPLLEVPMAPALYGISILFAISAAAFVFAAIAGETEE